MPPRLLSIVTITNRDPDGLKRTADSLRALGGSAAMDWEHVVVDSSPDETGRALDELRRSGWPLKHVHCPPQGVYVAQNTGIEQSEGRLIWLLNGGDELLGLDALETCLAPFKSDRSDAAVDIVVASVELRHEGRPLSVQRPSERIVRDLVGRNRVCHQGVIYRRDVFVKHGPFDTRYRLAADYDHLLRCLAHGARIETSPSTVLAAYDVGGLSSQRFDAVFAEYRQIHRALAGQVPLIFTAANELLRPIEHARVSVVKRIGTLPFGQALRRLWHKIKS